MAILKFEYCECGCKCFVADRYHIYWDLKDRYTLWEGRFRDNMQEFGSMDEAKEEAQRRYEKQNKLKLQSV